MAGKVYITENGSGGRGRTSSGAARGSAGNRAAASRGTAAGAGASRGADGNSRNSSSRSGQSSGAGSSSYISGSSRGTEGRDSALRVNDKEIEELARKMLRKKERTRRGVLIAVAALAVIAIGVFVYYEVIDHKNKLVNQMFNTVKDKHGEESIFTNPAVNDDSVVVHLDEAKDVPDVLPEYREMLAINSKLIGWLKIDPSDSPDGFPVAQTTDNEYYLTHDLKQNNDRNGTIFMDTNCDVLKPSTNLILYGHNMRSGKMFGQLSKYQDESYYEKHKTITFDTIYEHGTYEIMYVFHAKILKETEVAFKYYQFIDAYSEVEFDSYMNEMAEMSLYDTGVTASFGDRLLTLSTCDNIDENGRFVV
ncbi:MAG: class B sortase, partial [Lachnospiraceae bacterium]|nr:class B sortase [Lachnospiraceae bacterium]